ncbi:MAG TPA: hypothetical protein VIM61_11705 [Chthoniobacterales bacterium]
MRLRFFPARGGLLRIVGSLLLLGLTAGSRLAADAWTPPAGYCVPEETLPPDGTYGVLAPGWELYDKGDPPPRNRLVNVKTGATLLELDGPAWATWVQDDSGRTMNHLDLAAQWAKDGAVLAWAIDGKWSPAACLLVAVKDGAVAWHTDVLRAAQEKILAETRAAVPKNYAAARQQNEGSGAAFPEGFSIGIDLPPAGFTLPWRGHVTLDSNVKSIGEENWPSAANVGATMDFAVSADGAVTFSHFRIDPTLTGVPRPQ